MRLPLRSTPATTVTASQWTGRRHEVIHELKGKDGHGGIRQYVVIALRSNVISVSLVAHTENKILLAGTRLPDL
jgi:hypothetical protein